MITRDTALVIDDDSNCREMVELFSMGFWGTAIFMASPSKDRELAGHRPLPCTQGIVS
jgi:hypothetical protein